MGNVMTMAQTVKLSYSISGASAITCDPAQGTVLTFGEKVRISVTADSGYYFDTPVYLRVPDNEGGWNRVYFEYEESEFITHYWLDWIVEPVYYEPVTVKGSVTLIPKTDNYGIISVFNPTPKELAELSKVRYYKISSSGASIVDLGDFITDLRRFYIDVPVSGRSEIKLGGYKTGIEANTILDDIIEIDCGEVSITGVYNNAMDFESTTIEIYLPFVGMETLDTTKVMNDTISLSYKVNLLNGDALALVSNSNGDTLYTFSCNVSYQLPYRMNAEDKPKGKLDISTGYLQNMQPYVIQRFNLAQAVAGKPMRKDERYVRLGTLSGLHKLDLVNVKSIKAPHDELIEIQSLLSDYVIY